MPAPKIDFVVRSQKAKAGISEIRKDLARMRDDAVGAQQALSGIGGGRRGGARAAAGAREFARAQREAGNAASRSRREIDRAERELLTLKSTLGGAERASAQFARAQQRLERAQAAGLVTTSEASRLTGLMRQRFTTAEVSSRDLRDNMRGLNFSVRELAASASLALGPLSGVAARMTAVSGIASRTGLAFAGVTTALVGAGALVFAATRTASALDEIGKKADEVGVSVETLQELRLVGLRQGVENIDKGFEAFVKRLGEAKTGSGEAQAAFETLGISVDRLRDVTPIRALELIADRFVTLEDATLRNQVAADLFSRANQNMVNVLRLGADGITRLRERARELGIVFEESAIRQAERTQDRLTELGLIARAAGQRITSNLLPSIESVGEALLSAAVQGSRVINMFDRLDERTLGSLRAEVERLREIQDEVIARREDFPRISPTLQALGLAETGEVLTFKEAVNALNDRMLRLQGRIDAIRSRLDGDRDPFNAMEGGAADARRQVDLLDASFISLNTRMAIALSRAEALRRATGERLLPPAGLPGAPGPTLESLRAAAEPEPERERQPSTDDELQSVTPPPFPTPGGRGVIGPLAAESPLREAAERARQARQAQTASVREAVEALERENRVLQLRVAGEAQLADLTERRLALERQIGTELTPDQVEQLRREVGAQRALNRELEAQQELTRLVERGFDRIGSAITESFVKGEDAATSFRDVALGIISEIQQTILQFAAINPLKNMLVPGSPFPTFGDFGGGRNIGGAAGSLGQPVPGGGGGGFVSGFDPLGVLLGGIGSLFGFQHGGSFHVGAGFPRIPGTGIDDRLVAFRARDRERVTITPPGGQAPAPQVVVNAPVTIERLEGNVTRAEAAQIAETVSARVVRLTAPQIVNASLRMQSESEQRTV